MNIDKILNELSYRLKNGIPDLNSNTSLTILKQILKEQHWPKAAIEELIANIKYPSVTEASHITNLNKQTTIAEGTGDTSATTLFHEVITGIFVVDPNAVIVTGEDVLSYFKNGTIKAVNAGLGIVQVNSKYLNAKTFPDKKIISDAKSIANNIRSKFGTAKVVWWTGPTNDKSKFGAADIVIDGKYGISLKYGAGQLKNLTVNTFAQTVLGSNPDINVMKDIMKTYLNSFNNMTKAWLELFTKEVQATKNTAAIALAKSIASSNNTWEKYQKKSLTSDEIELFVNALQLTSLNISKTKDGGLRYLIKKLFEIKPWPQWQEIRNVYFNTIFGGYFKSIEADIANGLRDLFKKQLSVQENDLYYAAKGGTDFKYIPGEKAFDNLTSKLQFTYAYNPSGSGYEFLLSILSETGKPLGSISIKFRWKDGQMNGTIITTSDAKWFVKDWSEIIPGAK